MVGPRMYQPIAKPTANQAADSSMNVNISSPALVIVEPISLFQKEEREIGSCDWLI